MACFDHYLILFTKAVFIENMALAFFLGMCSFLACSKKVETAVGLGIAVVIVQSITVPMNQLVYSFLLRKGALSWVSANLGDVDLSFLGFLTYIGTIAAAVQLLEMTRRYVPSLYVALGGLPLIRDCVIMAGSLFMVDGTTRLGKRGVRLGSGVGWALAIIALARFASDEIQQRAARIARAGITFHSDGLMASGS